MKVNDLIFKELLRRGYSLEGNTRVWNIADSKLWYLTPKQAQAYLNLDKSEKYSDKMFDTELQMLDGGIKQIVDKVLHESSVNVIDIGCGDGKKAVPVVEEIHGRVPLRYCPIDISSHMVTKAVEKIKALRKGEVVQFRWNISDFENLENVAALLKDKEFRQNFFLFLGSTISNFEMHEVMHEIVEAMDRGLDYLLLGLAIWEGDDPKDLLKSYHSQEVDDFLSLNLTQVGFKKSDIQYGVRYKNSRIEMYYTVKKDKKITFGNQFMAFYKGDQILVGISRRYTKEQIEEALGIYFSDFKVELNKEGTWALVLCKK
jgi:uncharacterized SAM-dependent methyltransferase